MENRLWLILDQLSEKFKTAKEIGEELGLSEKTVRTRIGELEKECSLHGIRIYSKPRYGYCMEITDQDEWQKFREERYEGTETVPGDSKERVEYLLALFLNRSEYLKIDDISEFLYVSPKTITNELKRVEYILKCFDLYLERKPYYGIRAEGKEFNKRCCIIQNFYLSGKQLWGVKGKKEKDSQTIAQVLLEISRRFHVRFTETAFQNVVFYITLSISRMKKGLLIEESEQKEAANIQYEIKMAREIYKQLDLENMTAPAAEVYYTGVYIAGRRILELEHSYGANVIATGEIDSLVSRILEEIFLSYKIELRDDLNFRIMLIQHLIPMEIRIRYGIPVENVPDREMKEKYILAYSMAQLAAGLLSEHYQKELPEDEVACITMYFAMSLEESRSSKRKKNRILMVCVSGAASSRLLMYRFRKEFEDYIESLTVCGIHELDQVDFKTIDFVFTTVPIYQKVPVPIMEIHDFLEHGEIMSIRHFLQVGDLQFLNRFYCRELFFPDVSGDSKEEVIHEICTRINRITRLPDGFEESVLEREQFGPTDFGNMAAIPHPCRMMTKETLVAVAVLKKKILWSSNQVQVVILTSIGEEKDVEIQKFYDVTSSFLLEKEAVEALIQMPVFENFEKRITGLKR